jgi:hypothetical protein
VTLRPTAGPLLATRTQVVELLVEQTEEEESCGLQEVEVTLPASQADLVDVGCDAEVAELTCRARYIQVS